MTSPRWNGRCYRCHREREVETRFDHAAQALCDECTAKPHSRPSADGIDPAPPRPSEPSIAPEFIAGLEEWAGPAAIEPYRLLTIPDLATLRPPEWLIEDMVPEGIAATIGPAGIGKSFLDLDWALSVATGTPWFGRAVRQGPVVYIAAEGVSGIYRRVQAWLQERRLDSAPLFHVLPEPVNFLDDAAVARAQATVSAMPATPVLIVVDTIARTMVGGDENSARDMGLYVENASRIRTPGATLMFVHHEGWAGDHERGSTALRGAADLMVRLKPDGGSIRLECTKMKDAEEFEDWRLHLATVAESCVIRLGTAVGQLAPAERRLLQESHEAFGTREVAGKTLRDASTLSKSSYYRALKTLTDRGFMSEREDTAGITYQVSPNGLVQLSPNESQPVPRDTPEQSHRPRPLRDGGTPDPERPLADLTGAELQATSAGSTLETTA